MFHQILKYADATDRLVEWYVHLKLPLSILVDTFANTQPKSKEGKFVQRATINANTDNFGLSRCIQPQA